MLSSIPRMHGKKRCKVCLQNLRKTFWMENLGDKIKCPNCGREVAIGSRRSPHKGVLRSADPVRFRTGRSRQGNSGRDKDDFKPSFRPVSKKLQRTSVGKFPQNAHFEVFEEKGYREIVITLPNHKENDFECRVENKNGKNNKNKLIVKSLLDGFDFSEEFSLSEKTTFSDLQISFKNGILDIKTI